MRIGISGDIGSFSEEVGLTYASKLGDVQYELRYLIDMEGVLLALSQGQIEVGIFPFVNYNSGIVWPAFQAMGKYNFLPIDDLQLNVEQCLMALDGVSLSEIKELYSYTPAFEQCRIFIKEHNFKLIDWGDTAKAAGDLSRGILPKTAGVVGSQAAAKHYGLKVVRKGIQDIEPNITRFIVVKMDN